ncbi:MAG: hypothetical protein ACHQJ6_05625, partial [Candidatus Berkiellales bacterium]
MRNTRNLQSQTNDALITLLKKVSDLPEEENSVVGFKQDFEDRRYSEIKQPTLALTVIAIAISPEKRKTAELMFRQLAKLNQCRSLDASTLNRIKECLTSLEITPTTNPKDLD